MRTVKQVRLAVSWLCAGALCASCLHVDDISLGALEQDAGSEREPPDVAAPGPAPPPIMMITPDAGRADAAANASALDAGTDARPLDAGIEGGSDARGGDAGSDAALVADGGPLDAGSDAQRSLLCTLEPWHCL